MTDECDLNMTCSRRAQEELGVQAPVGHWAPLCSFRGLRVPGSKGFSELDVISFRIQDLGLQGVQGGLVRLAHFHKLLFNASSWLLPGFLPQMEKT